MTDKLNNYIVKENIQKWDFHKEIHYRIYDDQYELIAEFYFTIDKFLELRGIYVYEKHRNKGIFKSIIKYAIELFESKYKTEEYNELFILVVKDLWIIDIYKRFDFVYSHNYDDNDVFIYYKYV